MRLYEFTSSKDYILRDREAVDPSKQIKTIRRDDIADDVEPRLRKKIDRQNAP